MREFRSDFFPAENIVWIGFVGSQPPVKLSLLLVSQSGKSALDQKICKLKTLFGGELERLGFQVCVYHQFYYTDAQRPGKWRGSVDNGINIYLLIRARLRCAA